MVKKNKDGTPVRGGWAHIREGRLCAKHQKVVDFYFGVSNKVWTDACRRAGYKTPKRHGHVSRHPQVIEEVKRREAMVRARYDVTYERIMDELARIAFASPSDYMKKTDDGLLEFDFSETDPDQLRALGEVSIDESTDRDGRPIRRLKVKPWSKLDALDKLARHAGLSKEKREISITGPLADRILAGRARVATVIDAEAVDVSPKLPAPAPDPEEEANVAALALMGITYGRK